MKTKGFTLIELIIVIGLIALLATTVVLVINPAELLRQARDSQRLSDLSQINTALGAYMTTTAIPNLNYYGTCGSGATGSWWASINAADTKPFTSGTGVASASSTGNSRATNGTGWVPVNFGELLSGAQLPLDPVNDGIGSLTADTAAYYAYQCTTTPSSGYELNTRMESARYRDGGAENKEANTFDGGNDVNLFELGSILTL